jgi:hypothetical protein
VGDRKKENLKQDIERENQLPLEESRIIIRADGEVVIENLTVTLADAIEAMEPETTEVSCRLQRVQPEVDPDA